MEIMNMEPVIPGIDVCFEQRGVKATLCYIYVGNRLRVGATICSDKDSFDKFTGQKIAFDRALAQQDLPKEGRKLLWNKFLALHGIVELTSTASLMSSLTKAMVQIYGQTTRSK